MNKFDKLNVGIYIDWCFKTSLAECNHCRYRLNCSVNVNVRAFNHEIAELMIVLRTGFNIFLIGSRKEIFFW